MQCTAAVVRPCDGVLSRALMGRWLPLLSTLLLGVLSSWRVRPVLGSNQQCTYYGMDRYSSPEPNLANCSWFAENACCKRTEVTSVFAEMFQLMNAPQDCLNRISYLMCYFCSPDQQIWFRDNKATICRSFCDSIYESCGDSYFTPEGETTIRYFKDVFKASPTQDKPSDPTSDGGFCRDNFFDITESDKDCYRFDPNAIRGGASRSTAWLPFLLSVYGVNSLCNTLSILH